MGSSSGDRVSRRVRFALVTYQDTGTAGEPVILYGYRDDVIDLPAAEAARLDGLGAVVDPQVGLTRLGGLPSLPQNVSDEQLTAWIADASPVEAAQLVRDRPDLSLRIDGARQRLFDKAAAADRAFQRAQEAIGGIEDLSEPYEPADKATLTRPVVSAEAATVPAGAVNFDDVVSQSAEKVADWVADHPEHAAAVLQAETRSRGGHPRQVVERAVQAAVAHATQ